MAETRGKTACECKGCQCPKTLETAPPALRLLPLDWCVERECAVQQGLDAGQQGLILVW